MAGSRLVLKDGERLCPKNWGSTPPGGFGREVAVWLGYVDPMHEAEKLIQQITKGTLRATEAWTDGRHPSDDMYVELNNELAVALANATEGAARSTGLRVTQVWSKTSNDPAVALQPMRKKKKQGASALTSLVVHVVHFSFLLSFSVDR